MHHTLAAWLHAAIALIPSAALAQSDVALQAANPAVSVPAVRYDSAFAGYRSFRDEDLPDWRALNDDVARAGGHVGILGGAAHAGHGAMKPPSPSSAEAQQPMPGAPKAPGAEQHHQH